VERCDVDQRRAEQHESKHGELSRREQGYSDVERRNIRQRGDRGRENALSVEQQFGTQYGPPVDTSILWQAPQPLSYLCEPLITHQEYPNNQFQNPRNVC
jgi:hypothetical protein